MITHCPSCNTHFRVYPEQLAARAGQVRCGKCDRIFDALEHLIEEIAPARAPGLEPGFDTKRVVADETEPAPGAGAAQTQEFGQVEVQAPEIDGTADIGTDFPESEAELPQATGSVTEMSEPENLDSEMKTGANAFDFGPTVTVESVKPGRRWPWLIGALLLLLLLLAQAAYQYRSAIILQFPETKLYVAALCAKMGCELPLPRRIELMSIEASDLQADTTNSSVMVLTATIKNRANFNQQHPSLELTLTDAQDQPLVRRVLAPQNYLGGAVSTQAGFVANTEVAIKVLIEGSQLKATGYRLYLFYP